MSARCPTCNHGTSGCLLTEEEWEAVREAMEVILGNLQSYRPPDREDELIETLSSALEKMP